MRYKARCMNDRRIRTFSTGKKYMFKCLLAKKKQKFNYKSKHNLFFFTTYYAAILDIHMTRSEYRPLISELLIFLLLLEFDNMYVKKSLYYRGCRSSPLISLKYGGKKAFEI